MITQIIKILVYTEEQKKNLNDLKPHEKNMWDSPPNDNIRELKSVIRDKLLINQSETCAYCGLDLGGTSEGQIEHIAPKAKYPQFTFEEYNLAMACHHCNGFSKKGNHHTISTLTSDYSKCKFKLVHPYFDNPDNHYDWTSVSRKIIIKSKSKKADYSIEIFDLDEPKMTELRAKKIISEIVLATNKTPQIDDLLINQVLNFKEV